MGVQSAEAELDRSHTDFSERVRRATNAYVLLGSTLHWKVVDARRGVLQEGDAELSDLAQRKPWDYGVI